MRMIKFTYMTMCNFFFGQNGSDMKARN